jgi:GT2 family glycosyltransferase
VRHEPPGSSPRSRRKRQLVRSAVITVVSGRYQHLAGQRRSLRLLRPPVGLHVVVALDDPDVADRIAAGSHDTDPPTLVIDVPAAADGLPLAAGRNAGARVALAHGAQLLVFLDVDCLVEVDLIGRYADAALRQPGSLLCGPVTYLPSHNGEWTPQRLREHRAPHPARPDPPAGTLVPADPALFWSLSFAATSDTWTTVGGFDEGFAGYGAEDTDYARRAAERGVDMFWVGGADAYHQHHPTADPPVQHVDAILRNGARYANRWGDWPMTGWLGEFERLGLVRRVGTDWFRERPVRLASSPPRHPYVAAVDADGSEPVRPDRVCGWEPDPLLTTGWLRAHAQEIDVVHLHFGFEHLTSDELASWTDAARRLHLPVVVTVHDLRNPHLDENRRHVEHLRILLSAAAEVITLTAWAALEIKERYGRIARVLAHPTVTEAEPNGARASMRRRDVTVVLGTLRRNVREPAAIVASTVDGAESAGARVRVSVRREAADDPRLKRVHALADEGRVDLEVHERLTDDELRDFLDRSHAIVLPYRFGTHSGWVELARDSGTHVVAPSCGHYASQWSDVVSYQNDERRGLSTTSLQAAVRTVAGRPPAAAAERAERIGDRARIRAAHEVIYRQVMARR